MNKDLTAPVSATIAVIIGITFLIQQGKQSTVSTSASSSGVTAAPADAVSLGGTHSDASAHAPNIQSFGTYHVEATASESGNVELHFCTSKAGELMPIDAMISDVMDAKITVSGYRSHCRSRGSTYRAA